MKKVLVFALGALLTACNSGEETDYSGNMIHGETNKPTEFTSLEYDHVEYDYGKVTAGEENVHYFKVRNTGDKPLVIMSARASCGCTIPEKPEEPIQPGDTYDLKVIFKPKESQKGQIVEKTITVTANTVPSTSTLKIKGDVYP